MSEKTVTEKAVEIIKKYPGLEEKANAYLKTVAEEKETHLNIDALKVMEAHMNVKPLESLFKASAGADGIPEEVMTVLRKYPEFEERVNAYMRKANAEKEHRLRIDALNVLLAHESVEAVKPEYSSELVTGLIDIISKYPEAEAEMKEYLENIKKQQELNISSDALKAFEK